MDKTKKKAQLNVGKRLENGFERSEKKPNSALNLAKAFSLSFSGATAVAIILFLISYYTKMFDFFAVILGAFGSWVIFVVIAYSYFYFKDAEND